MMPAGLPAAPVPMAVAARPPVAGAEDPGGASHLDSGAGSGEIPAFAGMLGPSTTTAVAPHAAAQPAADLEPQDAATGSTLPDQLLALLGGWIPSAAAPESVPPPAPAPLGSTGVDATAMPFVPPGWAAAAAAAAAVALPDARAPAIQPLPASGVNLASFPAALPVPQTPLPPALQPDAGIPGLAVEPGSVGPMTAAVASVSAAADSGPSEQWVEAIQSAAAPAATGDQLDHGATPLTGTAPLASAHRTAPAAIAQPLPLPTNPDAGFDDSFGARIGWMAEQGIGRAELRVTPDHAGPIDVRLHIDGSRISAEFHSANADVRQALEASMGRLRDMLGQQGMQLAQSDVGQGRAGSSPQGSGGGAGAGDGADPLAPVDSGRLRPLPSRGLLDEYA